MALSTTDPVFLNAALEGLRLQQSRIEKQIETVRGLLGSGTPKADVVAGSPRKRGPMSAEARQRIADAQKKRWAAYNKKKIGKKS